LGKTGSGKSTLLNIIAGHEEITEGELFIDGELMNDLSAKDRKVAMVAQDYAYDEDGTKLPVLDMVHSRARLNRGALSFQMSVYENMAYDLKYYKVPKDEIDRRFKVAAELLDIEKLQYRKPKALSLGQRWRTAFGRALCRNPKVYLFDEPLWKIDAENHASAYRASFREELISIHRRLNMTTIYATPDEDKAWTDIADRVIIIKDGRIQ
jgi:multiple sugar transport system ATP-binding protein